MIFKPLSGIPADAEAKCGGRYELFDSVQTEDHFEARALCRQCPVLAACDRLRREVAESAYSTYGPRGTWAGKLYGAPYRPASTACDDLEERYTEDEARKAALAYQRGDKSEWALLGRRVYERRNRRRREEQKRLAKEAEYAA